MYSFSIYTTPHAYALKFHRVYIKDMYVSMEKNAFLVEKETGHGACAHEFMRYANFIFLPNG